MNDYLAILFWLCAFCVVLTTLVVQGSTLRWLIERVGRHTTAHGVPAPEVVDAARVDLRLGVAVVRGLLVDVVATGETGPATESLLRYLELWGTGHTGP